MDLPLSIQTDFSLRHLNTFGVDALAYAYLDVRDATLLSSVRNDARLSALPRLILGGGSNLLLTGDFPGLVVHMNTKGTEIVGSDADSVYVRAAAGVNWNEFVAWTLKNGLGGLENLSLIPGNVGATPIQNIGAYGLEVEERIHSLRVFDFDSGETRIMNRAACDFSYRDSIFKHSLRDRAVVLDVTFALPKRWQANIRYADVAQELDMRQLAHPDAQAISDAIVAIRRRKLPDPAVIGNAGSFFKNPLVEADQCEGLLSTFPHLVSYAQPDRRFKLAAGWLIDQCGWKGKRLGAAGVYEKQALVLVNHGGASGHDIALLAHAIQADVFRQFGVMLEPEPIYV